MPVLKKSTESGQKESKDELYFGYKVNVITDANHGLPMFGVTRPANASDVVVMVQDLDDCLALYETLGPQYFLGDKGYDSLENIKHLVSLRLIPVVAVRLPEKDEETGKRLYDGIYDKDGRPTCLGGKSMEYIETDPEKGHLFRCPAEGCHLKGKIHFTRYCDDQHYEKPEGRLLRIVGLLPAAPKSGRRSTRCERSSSATSAAASTAGCWTRTVTSTSRRYRYTPRCRCSAT